MTAETHRAPSSGHLSEPLSNPEAHVRAVRHRRLQPPRPRGGADRRRDSRAGIQPAVHLRPSGRRQDPPPVSHREPPGHAQPGPDRSLHDRRGIHERVPRRPRRRQRRSLQAPLSPCRRAAHGRRPVPGAQDEDGGGVLPHLQRPPRRRQPDRPHLRSAAGTISAPSRTGCESASRPASWPTSSRPVSPRAWRYSASAPTTTASSSTTSDPLTAIAERVTSNVRALEGALITDGRLQLPHRPAPDGRPSPTRSSTACTPDRREAGRRESARISEIQTATCKHFGLSTEELLSSARASRIAWPRQVAMYLSRELTNESLPVDRAPVRRERPHHGSSRLPARQRQDLRRRQQPGGCGEAVQRARLRPSVSTIRATTGAPDRLFAGSSTAINRHVHRSRPLKPHYPSQIHKSTGPTYDLFLQDSQFMKLSVSSSHLLTQLQTAARVASTEAPCRRCPGS